MASTFERFKSKFRIKNENQFIAVDPNTGTVSLKGLAVELQSTVPLSERIEYVKELSKIAKSYSLVEYINTLYDLIVPLLSETKEARECAYEFLTNLVEGNYEHLGLLKISIFEIVEREQNVEEFEQQFHLLCKLTNDGRNIINLELKIALIYYRWILILLSNFEALQISRNANIESEEKIKTYLNYINDLLKLIRNTLKFNFIYIEEIYISYLISSTCNLCNHESIPQNIISECLSILDVVVRYGYVPTDTLEVYVHTLCCNARNENFASTTYNIMNNLLRSHCAHNTIKIICKTLCSEVESTPLVQGSIFFLGKASWGNNRLATITYSVSTILRYIMQPIQYHIETIDLEILIAIKDLIYEQGKTLTYLEYETVLEILDNLKGYCEVFAKMENDPFNSPGCKLGDEYHNPNGNPTPISIYCDIINYIYSLYKIQQFPGSSTQYYDLLQSLSPYLSEQLSMSLIEYFTINQLIHPTSETWITDFNEFVSAFYTSETSSLVREKILNVINDNYSSLKSTYCSILIEQIIIPIVSTLSIQKDSNVIQACINLVKAVIRDCSDSHFAQLTHTFVECAMFNGGSFGSSNSIHSNTISSNTIHKNLSFSNLSTKNGYLSANDEERFEVSRNGMTPLYTNSIRSEVSMNNNNLGTNEVGITISGGGASISSNISTGYTTDYGNKTPGNKYFNPSTSRSNSNVAIGRMNSFGRSEKSDSISPQNSKFPTNTSTNKRNGSIKSNSKGLSVKINSNSNSRENIKDLNNTNNNSSNHAVVSPKSAQSFNFGNDTMCNEVSHKSMEALIEIFEACFGGLLYKHCPIVFGELLEIVRNGKINKKVRLMGLKCLFRLRANSSYRIYLEKEAKESEDNSKPPTSTTAPDNKNSMNDNSDTKLTTGFMSTLLSVQTSGSRIICRRESISAQGSVVSGKGESMLNELTTNENVMSTLGEKESVFDNRSIYSNETNDYRNNSEDVLLSINEYAETLIYLLKNETDYEIYSYILTNWVTQLTNIYLFQSSFVQIQNLRSLLVDMVVNDRLGKKMMYNIPNDVRISDLYSKAYNMLTVLIAYSKFFTKTQQDELILVFQIGLTKWSTTTRPCIHALLLCLLELPKSMTKLLTSTLVKMSQIMTASTFSVHLLEFLSLLAKLPHLYVNFVESDYKLVFVIALKYIQSTFNKKPITNQSQLSNVNNNSSSNINTLNNQPNPSTSAFNQYVIYLAYHVISVWFINLKLTERKKYVPFILHYILTENSHIEMNERVECCLDMLSRYSYSSCQSQPIQPLPTKILFENKNQIVTKHWIQGSVIISIKTLKNKGWGEIIIRRPTGTTSFVLRMENKLRNDSQSNIDLTALLMMHISDKNKSDALISSSEESENERDNNEKETQQTKFELFEKNEEIPEDKDKSNTNSNNENAKSNSSGDITTTTKEIGITKRSNSIAVNNFDLLKPNLDHDLKHKRSFSSGANIHSPLYLLKYEQANNNHLRVHSGPTVNGNTNTTEGTEGEGVIRRSRSASISYPKNKLTKNDSKEGENNTLSKITMQEIAKTWVSTSSINSSLSKDDPTKLLPSFVYLQLHSLGGNKKGESDSVYLLPDDDATTRGLSVLDRTPVVDLHKIGIVYVGRGQFDEQSILSNQSGSYHYQVFLQNIGKLVKLSSLQGEYTGGLDTRRGVDGEFAVMAEDEITKIVFHVATLMPTVEHDPKCMAKKRHIGNDYILIVYNESGKNYEFRTIPGQFNFINIIITPVDNDYLSMSHHQNILYRSNSNLNDGISSSTKLNTHNPLNSTTVSEENEPYFIVSMQRREDMPEIGPLAIPKIVSLSVLPIFVRQLATHFNIYAQTFRQNLNGSTEYISNWGERLRQIKRVKARVNKMSNPANPTLASSNNSQSSLHTQYKHLHTKSGAKTPLNISHHINSALTPNSSNSSPALSHKRGNPQHNISTNSIISSSSNDSVNSLNNGNGGNYHNNSSSIYNRAKSPERINSKILNSNNNYPSKDTNLEALFDFSKYT
ncbi:hypothetical protein BCR36DRAFT_350785 [Piromyces finnis]|uniref:Rap-GAP domain-containing protein n=1 Tax=Piromyces finnis TaxID=1754191 RepID=A0A1Y1VB52_9FUNG|nr:hypothetical protein BCR36DRAFT_350785 [Piromyces finnis]|eukprot:ORX51782.1 hypothetical protein BCR36DRAFT_350785 [Piromyces finnis]